ncbi:MAG: dienelactone hydrolase family protein [Balneolaceae bacterium]|nr:dienelactone hydrolase family protein [Balneolaceae bacterium]
MKSNLLFALILLLAGPLFAQDFALEQLEQSPRHHEWVEVQNGERTVHSFVAYPEASESTPAVIVIHENRGLTDWVRSFADQLAGRGYLAIAPDLLSGFDAEHERTGDFPSSDAARDALYRLDPEQITGDLKAVKDYIAGVPASTGTVAVMGFCWGGSQTFRFATNASDLAAAMVFYGSPPDREAAYRGISAPVYGFYGGEDARINATIPETEKLMEKHGKTYRYAIYEGAGHAFMRRGDDPDGSPANRTARNRSWERLEKILSGLK